MNPSPDREFLLHNLKPVRIEGAKPSKIDANSECSCRYHVKLRRLDRLEPLALGDRAWLAAVGLAYLALVAYAIYLGVRP